MACEILNFPSPGGLATAAARDWIEALQKQNSSGARPYTVALSGGRITRNFFEEIVRLVRVPKSGWESLFTKPVHFFWADERCVPPTDAESNYAMARQLLFDPLQIPPAQIHRLRGEADEATALRDAVAEIDRAASAGDGMPILDMVFLGMGEDGHVASLFPGESETVTGDPAIYRAVTAVKPPPRRFTLGYGAIQAARDVWILASGAGKEGALRESLSATGKTPLARVIRMRSASRLYTDIVLPEGLAGNARKS